MKTILIEKDKARANKIKESLHQAKILILNSTEALKHCPLSEKDLIISDLDSEEEMVSLEEFVANRSRLVCLCDESQHYAFEQYSQTIFIPRTSSDEMLQEAIARTGVEIIKEDPSIALIGSSLVMESVRTSINKYAKTQFSIHLSGNTGTGKNIAAKRIHKLSGLKSKMVYVNCGSCYNPGLIESNFFGYSKGSFTGSTGSRNGYLKNADKSILFLDEIENMSHQMQELLLDAIDSGTFRSVGSDMEISSDFRIITASNVSLDTLLEKGKLRYDFFYRIAQRKIHMPDLKDHIEDIPELVQYYEKKNGIIRNRITDYTPLYESSWPGNIRELFTKIGILHEKIEEERLYPIKEDSL